MVQFFLFKTIFLHLKLLPAVCFNEKDGRGLKLEKDEMPTKNHQNIYQQMVSAHW